MLGGISFLVTGGDEDRPRSERSVAYVLLRRGIGVNDLAGLGIELVLHQHEVSSEPTLRADQSEGQDGPKW